MINTNIGKREKTINKQSLTQRFFGFDGRLNRWEYFKRVLQLWLISLVINIVFGRGLGFNTIFGSCGGMIGYYHSSTIYFWGLISTFATISLITRRLHDLNRSGWWQLIFFVPFSFVLMPMIIFSMGLSMGMGFGLSGIFSIFLVALISIGFNLYVLFGKGTTGLNDYGPDPFEMNKKQTTVEGIDVK